MTNLIKELQEAAETLRISSPEEGAINHLKQAGYSEEDARYTVAQYVMEKEATAVLVAGGVDVDKAAAMVKAAKLDLRDIESFSIETEANPNVELMLKAASYIASLENQIATLEEDKAEMEKAANAPVHEMPETFTKAAKSGALTFDDLAELQRLSPEVLSKVASAVEQPWDMGRAAGVARPVTDPLLEFILG